MKSIEKTLLILTPSKTELKDLPKPIAPVPGTAAWDYLSGKKRGAELLLDPRLKMVLNPDDGEPESLFLFDDRSCLSGTLPYEALDYVELLTAHEC